MHHTGQHLALIAILLLACGEGGARSDTSSLATSRGATDPRPCVPVGALRTEGLSHARDCAEWFVAANGYTDRAVVDTTLVVGAFLDVGSSASHWLPGRRNTLKARSEVVCPQSWHSAKGYTVGFASPSDTVREYGRAVTMDEAFQHIRIEHVTYLLKRAMQDSTCRLTSRLPG
jgi:hypothetical protein